MKQIHDRLGIQGRMTAVIRANDVSKARFSGVSVDRQESGLLVLSRPNAFVNQGLENTLDRQFGLGGSALTHIILSGDSATVTATTTTIGTPNAAKAYSPAASRTNQTVRAGAAFDETDVNFIIRKAGLATSADPTDIQNIVGGAGGASPYDQDFTIDLTVFTEFDLTIYLDITAVAT